jgi:peptide-methionine (S)-S-oxide reductase
MNAKQKAIAEEEIAKAEAALGKKIVTPVLPAQTFWKAEDYHQNYYKGDGYVLTRRGPKVQSAAYAFYRKSCGRDARVRELWGTSAAFAH